MSEYLLDTHVLIWACTQPKKLSLRIKTLLEDNNNIVYVNVISFWEISIKYAKGTLYLGQHLPEDFIQYCIDLNFTLISPTELETSTLYQLQADYHKDPFDRMLIWQAIKHNYTLISDDQAIHKYKSEGLKVLW